MRSVEEGDWSLRLLTPPASEPLSLAKAKDHLRIDASLIEEDDTIADYVSAARGYLEDTYSIRLVKQQVEMQLEQFPRDDRIRLPIWPVQSVDYLKYTDVGGVKRSMTIAAGSSDPTVELLARIYKKPAEVVLPFGKVWPAVVLQQADAIRIGLTVGFVIGDSPETLPMPPAALSAMKLLIGHLYENRGAVTLGTLLKSEPLAIGVDHLMANVRLY